MVSGELVNRSLCVLESVKFDDIGATGAAIGFVLDLSLLHWTDSGEEVDKVLVVGRTWEISKVDDRASLAAVCGMIGE